MNAHFSNAVNSVAFTWGTQKTYRAAQFGEPRIPRNLLPRGGAFPVGGGRGFPPNDLGIEHGSEYGTRRLPGPLQDEYYSALSRAARASAAGPAVDMSPFWGGHSEPFEGDETGGLDEDSIYTDEMNRRFWELLDKKRKFAKREPTQLTPEEAAELSRFSRMRKDLDAYYPRNAWQ